MNSGARPLAGELPPWPFTIRMRRKPCSYSESSRSRTTAMYVSARSVGLPGYAAKYGVRPYGSDGSTGTPSGSAASTDTRSDRIVSTPSER